MEVGQPSAPAPRAAREAAKAALDLGRIGYTEALGISALRERIARHYREAYGVDIAPERVVVTTGSSAGFVLAFLSLFDPGAAGRDHGAGLSGLSQHPGGARHRAGDDPAHQGRRLDHDGRGRRKSPCGEALARHSGHEPGQSVRHHDRPQGPRRTRRDLPPPRALVRLGRDLSWPDLRRGRPRRRSRPTTMRS